MQVGVAWEQAWDHMVDTLPHTGAIQPILVSTSADSDWFQQLVLTACPNDTHGPSRAGPDPEARAAVKPMIRLITEEFTLFT